MGRVWHLEGIACRRMKETARLVASAHKVCRTGLKANGYWRERYLPQTNGTVSADGAEKYCEYPAILVRRSSAIENFFGANSGTAAATAAWAMESLRECVA